MKIFRLTILFFIVIASGCKNTPKTNTDDSVAYNLPQPELFQDTINGKATDLFILKNQTGMQVAITNYGGRIVSLIVPDKNNNPVDVIVGCGSLKDFQSSTESYFGALIGRVGNRIANGKFSVDDNEYKLATNNGANTLHGGINGYHKVVWDAIQQNDSTLELKYLSKDGEEGFPGNLEIIMVYSISSNNDIILNYKATTDKKTPVNLTNHAFFNLNGSGSITNHVLQINAQKYLPVDAGLIPLGNLESVEGTPFDFRLPTNIGQRLDTTIYEQLKPGKGYDHNFILSTQKSDSLLHAASITGDISGITMEVYTQEPGLQFYSGNFMQGKNMLKYGFRDEFRNAFCLETQHYPDSPNQPAFPSIILNPGELYQTTSVYRFLTAK
jgi:aldose 1-epimerase